MSAAYAVGWASPVPASPSSSGTEAALAPLGDRRDDVFRPVWRERVMRRIDEAARYRIVGIVAPAGFGKSIVLRQYLQSLDAVRFDVPRGAASLAPFAAAFADALAGAAPGLRGHVATLPEGELEPACGLAMTFAAALAERDLVVVLDGLQAGDGDPEIARFVTALVGATPRTRWFLASRTQAGLPFASWIAYGEADFTIEADDLRLTPDEARACTQEVRARISDERLEQLCGFVDGWPAAFQFAVRSLLRSAEAPAADGARELVHRYLVEQVWSALDPALRAFLRTAAFLPALRLEHCFAAGFADAQRLVEKLRQCTAFVRRSDDGELVLHAMFREFVQQHVLGEGEAAARGAWQPAAAALESAGAVGDALDCYVRARGRAEIRACLRAHGTRLVETGALDVLERALRCLGRGDGAGEAALDVLRGRLAAAHGYRDEAEYHMHRALEALDGLELDTAVELGAAAADHYAKAWKLDALPALDALAARAGTSPAQRALLLAVRAATLVPHDLERAVAAVREALALVEPPGVSTPVRTAVFEHAAAVLSAAGETAESGRYAAGAANAGRAAGRHGPAGSAWLSCWRSAKAQGRTEIAASAAREALDAARRSGDVALEGRVVRSLLADAAARGAEDEIAALRALPREACARSRARLAAQAEALGVAFAWDDRFDDARDVLLSVAEDELFDVHNRARYAILAAVSVAGGAPRAECQSALERYRHFAQADRAGGRGFDAERALHDRWAVIAELVLHGAVKARRSFARRLPLQAADAGVDQCVLGLLDESYREFEAGLGMLRRADRAGHARFIESVCACVWANRGDAGTPQESLTACEVQVLRGLADGLSNRAIAEGSGRSVNTIKSQVTAILRKLGTPSRSEAVAAGRRRGLVTVR